MNRVKINSGSVRGLVAATTTRRPASPNSAFRAPRSAFTLTEMIVSIGILVLMMSMVGSVFQVTTESTGQARALMEVSATVRLLLDTLQKDLANLNPQRSILVIQTNPINAYWKVEQGEVDPDGDPSNGYIHPADPERELPDGTGDMDAPRADMLMFFTSRKQRSVMYPDIWSNIAQVVYGHAEIGELDNAGAWVAPPVPFPAPGIPFNTPAENWHLARRAVLLVDLPEAAIVAADTTGGLPGSGNDVPSTLDDATDVGGDNLYPGITPLVDGVIDFVDNTLFAFEAEVVNRSLVTFPLPIAASQWWLRSGLDLQPHATQASRIGHYFIPKCASFKVEWALDLRKFAFIPFNPNSGLPDSAPREIIWFDPANPIPLGELNVLAAAYAAGAPFVAAALNVGPGSLMTLLLNRFTPGIPPMNSGITPQTPVWFANDLINGGSLGEPDRYFPVALRITVDLYDHARRLDRPIRHVFVLPIGSG